MISGKIDVTKLDKSKFFKGKKGIYADIVLIDTPNGEFGDYMIVQGVSKEEREAGVRGAVLGNAKVFGGKVSGKPATQRPRQQANTDRDDGDSPVPF